MDFGRNHQLRFAFVYRFKQTKIEKSRYNTNKYYALLLDTNRQAEFCIKHVVLKAWTLSLSGLEEPLIPFRVIRRILCLVTRILREVHRKTYDQYSRERSSNLRSKLKAIGHKKYAAVSRYSIPQQFNYSVHLDNSLIPHTVPIFLLNVRSKEMEIVRNCI